MSVTGVYQTSLPVNTLLTLGINVGANGAGGSAFADPMLSIDPSFVLTNSQYSASEFSIADSSDVANAVMTGVPEAGSATLLAMFLAGLGLLTRRRPVRVIA